MPIRTTTRPITNLPDEKRPQPRKNGGPSSEVNVDDILALAREVDAQAQAEPEEPKKKTRKKAQAETAQADVLPAEPLFPPDPEFMEMLQWGVGQAVEVAKLKLDWSEPGIHWRSKVTVMVARLWVRLQPMSESWVTDLITLGGYSALWIVPNVTSRVRKSPASDRNDGNGQNIQDARTP